MIWGTEGREFKSPQPDNKKRRRPRITNDEVNGETAQVVGFVPGEVVNDHLRRVGEDNCLHQQPDCIFHLD